MKVTYDGEARALYIYVSELEREKTEELIQDTVFIDKSKLGQITGIEVLGVELVIDRGSFAKYVEVNGMAKQDIIREGVAHEIANKMFDLGRVSNWDDCHDYADVIVEYLHSQGLKFPNGEPLIEGGE